MTPRSSKRSLSLSFLCEEIIGHCANNVGWVTALLALQSFNGGAYIEVFLPLVRFANVLCYGRGAAVAMSESISCSAVANTDSAVLTDFHSGTFPLPKRLTGLKEGLLIQLSFAA